MNVALNILAGPLDFCFYVLHELQKTFFMVSDSVTGRQPLAAAALERVASRLGGWVLLALIIAGLIYWTLAYVCESLFSGPLTLKDLLPVLGSMFWRLVSILLIYVCLAFLFYAIASYGHLVLSGMNLPRHITK